MIPRESPDICQALTRQTPSYGYVHGPEKSRRDPVVGLPSRPHLQYPPRVLCSRPFLKVTSSLGIFSSCIYGTTLAAVSMTLMSKLCPCTICFTPIEFPMYPTTVCPTPPAPYLPHRQPPSPTAVPVPLDSSMLSALAPTMSSKGAS